MSGYEVPQFFGTLLLSPSSYFIRLVLDSMNEISWSVELIIVVIDELYLIFMGRLYLQKREASQHLENVDSTNPKIAHFSASSLKHPFI